MLTINKENSSLSDIDLVMASCFLDTLPRERLAKTLEQASEVLKAGGILFHISDLQPFINTLAIDNKDQPGIMFPLVEEDGFFKGIQFVPRDACEKLINTEEGKRAFFLRKYITLSNDTRGAVVVEICTMMVNAISLSNWVKKNFTNRTEIINEQFFNQRLEQELKKTDFEMIKCGIVFQQAISGRSKDEEEGYNDFCSLHGHLIKTNTTLKENEVRNTLSVHLVIAQKRTHSAIVD